MSRKIPVLIIVISVYLLLSATVVLLSLLYYLFLLPTSTNSIRLISIFFVGLCGFFLMTGIGLLRHQRWARTSALVIFGLTFFGGLQSISSFIQSQPDLSTGAQLGSLVGKVVALVLSGVSFCGLSSSQSVKTYFKRS